MKSRPSVKRKRAAPAPSARRGKGETAGKGKAAKGKATPRSKSMKKKVKRVVRKKDFATSTVKRVMQEEEELGKMAKEVPARMGECAALFIRDLIKLAVAAPAASSSAASSSTASSSTASVGGPLTAATIKRALALELKRDPKGRYAFLVRGGGGGGIQSSAAGRAGGATTKKMKTMKKVNVAATAAATKGAAAAGAEGAFDHLDLATSELGRQLKRARSQRALKRQVRAQAVQPFQDGASPAAASDLALSTFGGDGGEEEEDERGGAVGRGSGGVLTERERALDDEDEEEYG